MMMVENNSPFAEIHPETSEELLRKQDVDNAIEFLKTTHPHIVEGSLPGVCILETIGSLIREIRMLRNIAKSDRSVGIVNELLKSEFPKESETLPKYKIPMNADDLLPRYDKGGQSPTATPPGIASAVTNAPYLDPIAMTKKRFTGKTQFSYRKRNAGRIK